MKWIAATIGVLMIGAVGLVLLKPQGRAVIREMAAQPDVDASHRRNNKELLKLPLIQPRIEVTKSKRELLV